MFIINEGELGRFSQEVVTKKWGKEFILVNNDSYCCKLLKIKPGFRSSVHMHKKKDETFIGISGAARLDFYNKQGVTQSAAAISPGVRRRIQPGQFHSFEAQSETWVLEISTSHDDKDVTRLVESRNLNE